MLKRPKVMLGTYCQFLVKHLLIEVFLKTILKKIFTLLERNFSFDFSNLKLSVFFRTN